MRLEVQENQRPQHLRIAERGRELQSSRVHSAGDQPEPNVQHGRATIMPLELGAQGLEHSPQHKRERLGGLDWPFQHQRLLEPWRARLRAQGPKVLPASQTLYPKTRLTQTLEELARGKCGQVPECREPPLPQRPTCQHFVGTGLLPRHPRSGTAAGASQAMPGSQATAPTDNAGSPSSVAA